MKTIRRSLAGLLVMVMMILILPLNVVSAKSYNVDDEFIKLQNNVGKVLKESGYKYIYNEQDVRKAVANSSFNWNLFNEKYNTTYNNKSFSDEAIKLIKNTDLAIDVIHENGAVERVSRDEFKKEMKEHKHNGKASYSRSGHYGKRGKYCGRNHVSRGWNYVRESRDKWRTTVAIYDYNQAMIQIALRGLTTTGLLALSGVGSVGAVLVGIGAGSIELYIQSLMNSTSIKNHGHCGTVTNINKFTRIYNVWAQDEYWGF